MAAKPAKERKVGTVEHYYPKVKAAAVGLEGDLKLGDTIHIKGHSDDVTRKVTSLQLDHEPIQEGHAGDHVGVLVPTKVHEHSEVFKVEGATGTGAPRAKPKAAKAKAAKPAKRSGRKAPTRKAKAKGARRAKKAPKRKARKARAKAKPRRTPKRKAARSARKPARGARKGKGARKKR